MRLVASTGTDASGARPERLTTSGARWTGIPMNRSYGTLPPLVLEPPPRLLAEGNIAGSVTRELRADPARSKHLCMRGGGGRRTVT
jgi:hypothetical protein